MNNIFYRRRFLDNPSLILFLLCPVIMSFSGSFVSDLLVSVYLIAIFIIFDLLFKIIIPIIPRTLRYPLVMLTATALMTITYNGAMLLLAHHSALYPLLLALFTALSLTMAYIDYSFYNASLVSTMSVLLTIACFLLVFCLVMLFLIHLISGHMIGGLTQLPMAQTLGFRLILFAFLLATLKHLLRGEP